MIDFRLLIGITAILVFIVSVIRLHWLAVRDGYAPDAMLLLTGIPVYSYVIREWNRAKGTLLTGVVALILATIIFAMA